MGAQQNLDLNNRITRELKGTLSPQELGSGAHLPQGRIWVPCPLATFFKPSRFIWCPCHNRNPQWINQMSRWDLEKILARTMGEPHTTTQLAWHITRYACLPSCSPAESPLPSQDPNCLLPAPLWLLTY